MKRFRRILKLGPRTKSDARAELSAEFAHHLALREAELVRGGLSAEAARAEAQRAFGDVDAALSRCLAEDLEKMDTNRRAAFLDELKQDVRFGVRQLLRDPAFAVLAIATLALGIGLNAAVFTIVDALFIKRLPYPAPEQLVAVQLNAANPDDWQGGDPYRLELVRERTKDLGDFASSSGWTFTLSGEGPAEALAGAAVTPNFFTVLGVRPLHGRVFTREDAVPGQRTAILSYGLWQRRFGGDPAVIGRTINLEDGLRAGGIQVVGVMPPSFAYPTREAQLWLPFVYDSARAPSGVGTEWFGRLRPGIALERASAQMQSAIDGVRADHTELSREFGVHSRTIPLRAALVGEFRTAALILFAAVTFVLLIACANVANLLLTRATGRSTELAVRASLGAGRSRIVRQLLTENLLIALLAALVGFALAWATVRVLSGLLPQQALNFSALRVDARVLAYTMSVGVLTVLLFGAAPALRLPFDRAFEALKASGRANSATGSRRALLRGLIAGEVALAVVLGVGAVLMLQSFWRLRHENVGFNSDGVLSLRISVPRAKYPETEQRAQVYNTMIERMVALPGVTSAGAVHLLPLGGGNWNPRIAVEGLAYPTSDDQPEVDCRVVTPAYFETMRVPLVTGRAFDATDDSRAPGVALVNQMLVRKVFNGENPIGKRVRTAFEGRDTWTTIVGVVGDTKDQALTGDARPQIYRPYAQFALNSMTMLLRVSNDPMKTADPAQRAIRSIDNDITITDVQPMNRVIGDSVAQPRLLTALLSAFGALAVLLGAIGIYGVMAYAVGQRRQEMGIRAALGARPADLLRLVLGEGARTALVGTGVGVLGALVLSRTLETQLYEVKPLDPASYLAVAMLVMLVALLATLIPARHAGRMPKTEALRG